MDFINLKVYFMKNKKLHYTDEIKKELDKRYDEYKSGKIKLITAEESKKRIQKILNASR
ncbi:MAG: addiction module protein [Ferruginibacter sp.]|nr:addiction module protein [Ferruginibacter sp.]